MRTKWNNFYLLMDAAGDGNGGGAGSALLDANKGGSGSAAGAGGANTGAASGAGAAGAAGASSATGNQGGAATPTWRDALPTELREEPSIKLFNDVSALAKSYLHAQKQIGADKLSVPGKHATDEDWNQVYSKLGLPKELKDYDVKLEGDMIDKDFVSKFKETAHKAGILPKQAQLLANWFQEVNKTSTEQVKQQREQQVKTQLEGLKAEWGAAYQQNLSQAAMILQELNDPLLNEYVAKTGLGNDPQFIKLCQRISSKYLKEGTIVEGQAQMQGKLTPAQAQIEANKILGDTKHPYYDTNHPNHKAAVAEVQGYFNMVRAKAV